MDLGAIVGGPQADIRVGFPVACAGGHHCGVDSHEVCALLAPITVKLLAPAPLESAIVRLPNSQKIRLAKSSRAFAAVIETRLETESSPPDPALAETYSCLRG